MPEGVEPRDDGPMTVDELELFALVVPSSRCGVKWSDLKGGEQTRTCSRCSQRLHSVASLSVDDAIALSRGDHARAKLFLRRDGTVKVRDCPSSRAAEFIPAPKLRWPTVLVCVGLYLIYLCGLITLAGSEIRQYFGDTGPCCVVAGEPPPPPRGRKRSNASQLVGVQPQTPTPNRSRR